jgi:chaperone required for assembly of F1-ATPase
MKRFYKEASAGEVEGGYGVLLDGRPMRTPQAARLAVPTRPLAQALAGEWDSQGEKVTPAAMPLTQIACTAIDLVTRERDRAVEEVVSFAEAELLCYRADAPRELVQRQVALWQPLLDWLEATTGAALVPVTGIVHTPQPPESLERIRTAVEGFDGFGLAALAMAVRASGSLVVGLALAKGRLSPEEAFAAAELDETYSIEQWGEDPVAADRRAILLADLVAARRFLDLLRPSVS